MLRHLVLSLFLLNTAATCQVVMAQNTQAHNPVIYADVPDMSIIRVGNKYYMSSTTMHMSPGVPIMESTDLVNWKMISYAYQTLDTINSLSLKNGESTYGRGSWASCYRCLACLQTWCWIRQPLLCTDPSDLYPCAW